LKGETFQFLVKLVKRKAHCGRYFNSHLINYAAQLDPKSGAALVPLKYSAPLSLRRHKNINKIPPFHSSITREERKRAAWSSLSSAHTHHLIEHPLEYRELALNDYHSAVFVRAPEPKENSLLGAKHAFLDADRVANEAAACNLI
jgi:hypothetical protein